METAWIKKLLQSLYFLLIFFLLIYISSIWLTVFTVSSNETKGPALAKLGTGFGISGGDTELAFYVSIVLLFLCLIPIIVGLIKYWKNQSKKDFFKWTSIITTIILLSTFLINKFILGPIFLSPQLPFGIVFLILVFTILIYLFLLWILDKKWWIHFLVFVLIIILLVISFILPFKLYMASGCNNYQDMHCVGQLAASKKDSSLCEKLNEDGRVSCLYSYIHGMMGSKPVKDREISEVTFCSSLSTSIKVSYINTELSMQAYCFQRVTSYFNTAKKKEICEMITNNLEEEYCKKSTDCFEISVSDPKYNKCMDEAAKITGIKLGF